MMLQEALDGASDGVMGPTTLAAAKRGDPSDNLADFLARRALHYAELPASSRYGRGWMRRLFQVQPACLRTGSSS